MSPRRLRRWTTGPKTNCGGRSRTCNPLLNREWPYRWAHTAIKSGRWDSNPQCRRSPKPVGCQFPDVLNKREHPAGVEPARPAWEAGRLPLHHGCNKKSRMSCGDTRPGKRQRIQASPTRGRDGTRTHTPIPTSDGIIPGSDATDQHGRGSCNRIMCLVHFLDAVTAPLVRGFFLFSSRW